MKKQRIARRCTIYLAFAFAIILSFSGCSSKSIEANDEDDFSLADLSVIIPDGKKRKIASYNDISFGNFIVLREKDSDNTVFVSDGSADLLDIEIYKRNTALSSEYGLSMTEIITDDIASRAKNEVLSGTPSFDMLQFTGSSAAALITSGVLCDLALSSSFDASLAGYHSSVIEALSTGDHTYIVAGDATPSLLLNTSCILLNTELSKKLDGNGKLAEIVGTSSLIEAAVNGKFTTDTMIACSKAMASLSGASPDEIDSNAQIASSSVKVFPEKALALYLGGGLPFYEIDKITDEIIPAAFGAEYGDTYTTLEFLFGIDENTVQFPEKNASSALFTVSDIKTLFSLLKENSPFAPLPIPKYSSAAKSYFCYTDIRHATFNAIPKNPHDTDEKIETMNLIYSLSADITAVPRTLLHDSVVSSGENTLKKAEYAVKNFDIIVKSARVDLISLFGFGDLPEFMSECINERTTRNAFMSQGANRTAAAVRGVSISIKKIM